MILILISFAFFATLRSIRLTNLVTCFSNAVTLSIRGVKSENYNVFVKIEDEGIVAWGESSPGNSEGAGSAEEIISQLSGEFNDIK